MIVIAIIGILAAVAVPQYSMFTKRAKYSELISQTSAFKVAVGECVQHSNTLIGCTNGANNTKANMANSGYTASISTSNGVISATAVAELDGATYILTPTYTAAANKLTWSVSGSCETFTYC